jgi:hypothetical protein
MASPWRAPPYCPAAPPAIHIVTPDHHRSVSPHNIKPLHMVALSLWSLYHTNQFITAHQSRHCGISTYVSTLCQQRLHSCQLYVTPSHQSQHLVTLIISLRSCPKPSPTKSSVHHYNYPLICNICYGLPHHPYHHASGVITSR